MSLLAQPEVQQQTAFPFDNQKPTASRDADLLESICPGRVKWAKEVICSVPCPEFTGFAGDDFGWSHASVTRGHFLSSESDDATVATLGCESHSDNFGGTILLTRRSGQWKMLWYKGGVDTAACHKVGLADRREILVCLGGTGAQGYLTTSLYIEDLASRLKY
jgi:hypothetical protein